jgi:spermidine synthase
MDITRTRHGLRLSQHGVVISELRTAPGPTHSVFDVLAALITVLRPAGRVGVLGFAGGGMMAPLAALGWETPFDTMDLDRDAYELFRQHCPHWAGRVNWHHADAAVWLRRQRPNFSLLLDDLSVPADGDVFKPALCWDSLPALIRARLRSGGLAVFNLLLSPGDTWPRALPRVTRHFADARVIHLDDFENRLLLAGEGLPSAQVLSAQLRAALRQIRSRQAGRIQVRSLALGRSSSV